MKLGMAVLILGVALAAAPAFAHEDEGEQHEKSYHGPKNAPKDAPRSFASQPAEGTWAKCPVSGEVFKTGPKTRFATWQGRVYAMCCDDCKPDFDKDPGKYADTAK